MPVVLSERKGHIFYVTLNRPEALNALSNEVIEELEKCWIKLRDDKEAWVAILTGNGRAFSAGLDLKERSNPDYKETPSQGMHPIQLECYKPIICAVNGIAMAGGFLLAMNSDIRIASENAVFGITEVKVGLPALGLDKLFRYTTLGIALELLLTGETFTAQKALDIGFANYVVPPDKLIPKAEEIAEQICSAAPLAVWATKETVYRSLWPSLQERHSLQSVTRRAMESGGFKEAARAFTEKRKPVFKAE